MSKKQRFKFLKTTAATVFVLGSACCGTAFAGVGWSNEAGEWEYRGVDNVPVTDAWRKSGEEWYWLDSNGKMAVNRLIEDGDKLYYLEEDGRMASNVWKYLTDDEGESNWYYFSDNGKAYRRTASNTSFKKVIDGKTYAFDEDGKLLYGWLDRDGNSLQDTEDPFIDGVYFAGEDGAFFTEKWMNWGNIGDYTGGSHAYSQLAERSYNEYESLWFYFNENGKKLKSNSTKLVEKKINGSTYGFDENGVMVPWWSGVSIAEPPSDDHQFGSNNRVESYLATDSNALKYYSGYDGGVLMGNKWFWMYPSENLNADDYWDSECSWWYTDANGKVYTDRIKKINGKSYAFDGIGRMRTGFVLFDGKSHFVGQYDVDTFSSKDFMDGEIGGIERSDLYLFSPDELNDGSMQMGSDIKVELSDGVYTFGFGSNGVAFGNGNQMQKKDDYWYINGLKLQANPEFGYGVIQVKEGDKCYYQVVSESGKIVKGKRKLVKDRDGGYFIILDNYFGGYVNDADKPRWVKNGDGSLSCWRYDASREGSARFVEEVAKQGMFDEPNFNWASVYEMLSEESKINFEEFTN